MIRFFTTAAAICVLLTACSGGGSSGAGVSTASILGEAPAAVSADNPGITKDDPMARPVQVAWTAARAERCGFNFDASRLKSNFLAAEQRQGLQAAQVANYDRAYDMTFARVKGNIKSPQEYCTERQAAAIKADLTRHLAGDYAPNFPADRALAQKTMWEQLASNDDNKKLNPKTIWQELEDRKNGVRTAQ